MASGFVSSMSRLATDYGVGTRWTKIFENPCSFSSVLYALESNGLCRLHNRRSFSSKFKAAIIATLWRGLIGFAHITRLTRKHPHIVQTRSCAQIY